MTTGEKLAMLRKKKGITQEELSEILGVSRQSVSRWEMDVSFPETEKLIKLSRLFDCSIDFLLNSGFSEKNENTGISFDECRKFIKECGYFFIATVKENKPRLRPFGMIYSNEKGLYIATDKQKNAYKEIKENPFVEVGSYNLATRKWIRISAEAEEENSIAVHEEMINAYSVIKAKYIGERQADFVIFRLSIQDAYIE
ncbi:MAG: helix-turn-helix domain-containing protein [Ruminococcaceae bacterium]|nr:helix-turn-helix domain-containing protein [Oscillospiraceae bacterium]